MQREPSSLMADIPAVYGDAGRRPLQGRRPGRRAGPALRLLASTTPARSGSPTSRSRSAQADRQQVPRTSGIQPYDALITAGRPLLPGRPVRRGRHGAARPLAAGGRGVQAHPRRLRQGRRTVAGLQDAAPGGLGAWPATCCSCRRSAATSVGGGRRAGWREVGRIAVHGQPVFAVAQARRATVWVNFAHPRNDVVQVIDVPSPGEVVQDSGSPARRCMHMEFTPRGEACLAVGARRGSGARSTTRGPSRPLRSLAGRQAERHFLRRSRAHRRTLAPWAQ